MEEWISAFKLAAVKSKHSVRKREEGVGNDTMCAMRTRLLVSCVRGRKEGCIYSRGRKRLRGGGRGYVREGGGERYVEKVGEGGGII